MQNACFTVQIDTEPLFYLQQQFSIFNFVWVKYWDGYLCHPRIKTEEKKLKESYLSAKCPFKTLQHEPHELFLTLKQETINYLSSEYCFNQFKFTFECKMLLDTPDMLVSHYWSLLTLTRAGAGGGEARSWPLLHLWHNNDTNTVELGRAAATDDEWWFRFGSYCNT